MEFQYGGAALDLCVLALASHADLYGYRLTQQLKQTLSISESTLYPVLRRLTKNGYLTVYDRPYDGRNRRYYSLTSQGKDRLEILEKDWMEYVSNISQLLERNTADER